MGPFDFSESLNLLGQGLPKANLIGRGEIVGNVHLGDASGGRPFRAPLEGHDKSDASQLFRAMTEYCVEHSSFPVADGEQSRLMFARAFLRRIGVSGG
jgi:hypothetical protein